MRPFSLERHQRSGQPCHLCRHRPTVQQPRQTSVGEPPDIFVMYQVVGQKSQGFLRVRQPFAAVLQQFGDIRNQRVRRHKAAGAAPENRIDMGVDLHQPGAAIRLSRGR